MFQRQRIFTFTILYIDIGLITYSADNFLFHFTNWLIKDPLLNLRYEATYSDRRVGQVQNTLPKKEYVYYQEIIKGFYLYTLKLLKFNDSNVVQQNKYNWFFLRKRRIWSGEVPYIKFLSFWPINICFTFGPVPTIFACRNFNFSPIWRSQYYLFY